VEFCPFLGERIRRQLPGGVESGPASRFYQGKTQHKTKRETS